MKSLTDRIEIPVECSSCHRKVKKTLAELKKNPNVRCSCGVMIKVEGADKASKPFDNLDKSLKKLGFK